jgi:hypothetical protein
MDTLAVPVPKNEFTIKQEDMPTLLSVWSEIFVYAYVLIYRSSSVIDLSLGNL